MKLLNGKEIKRQILEDLKKKVLEIDRPLGLAVIQIGDDPASNVYIRQKSLMAESLNYDFKHIKLDERVSEEDVLKVIDALNEDEMVDGILIQMPVPRHINPRVVQNRIDNFKDVDGLSDLNAGKLVHNKDALVPCTALGIIDLLDFYNISISGKNVVIVGRSDLVGKPLSHLMTNRDATVTLCHSKTENLSLFTRNADILVVAVGKPKFIKAEDVKDGAVVIDVGINRVDGELQGDVDFDAVLDKVSYITPVPGGIGQMTVAELGHNTYKAYILKKNLTK